MATAIGDLVIRLGAQTTQFDKRMRMARGQVRTMGPATARMGAQMAGGFAVATAGARALTASLLAMAAPFVGVIAAFRVLGSGETFNQKMRQSLAIMDDIGESMRTNLRDTAIEVARTTRFSMTEAAEAYFFLFSAGLKANQALLALPRVAKFAQAGNFDLATATRLATGAQAAMGLKSADAAQNLVNLKRVTDVLVKANKLAQASTEQFATALGNDAANAARVAGASIEETVALLAVLAEKMIVGEEAGTAIARMFNLLQIQAVNFKGAFRKAGIKVFDEATGEMSKMFDILVQLEDRFRGMGAEQRTVELMSLGFTKKTVALANAFLGSSGRLGEFLATLKEAGGTVDEVAGKQLTALQRGWAQLGTTFSVVGQKVIDWLGPKLEVAMKRFSNFLRNLPDLLDMVSQSATIVGQLFREQFGGAIDAVTQLSKPFTDSFAEAFTVMADNLDTMLGSWEGFSEGVINLTKQTTLAVQALWSTVVTGIAVQVEKLPGRIQRAFSFLQEQAPFFFGENETAAIGRLENARIREEERANEQVRQLRLAHEKKMAAIGRDSLREERRHAENRAKFRRLSGDPSGGRSLPAPPPGSPGEALDRLATVGATEGGGGSPAALERRSTAAFSSIIAAMNLDRNKPMKEVAKNTKRAADGIDMLNDKVDGNPEPFQEIPD